MPGAIPSQQKTNFTETYDRLARAWADHEDLRRAGATIPELYQSSVNLGEARNAMWAWWRENRFQEAR